MPVKAPRRQPYSEDEMRTVIADRAKHPNLDVNTWAKKYPIQPATYYTFLRRLKMPTDRQMKASGQSDHTDVQSTSKKAAKAAKAAPLSHAVLPPPPRELASVSDSYWKTIAHRLIDRASAEELREIIKAGH